MRVAILSVGSRGDVQPLLAFAAGLASAGHEVRCATLPKFEPLVAAAGLEFAPLAEGRLGREAEAAADGAEGGGAGSRGPMLVRFLKDARAVGGRRLRDALAACEGAEAIVANELAMLVAWQVARHLRVKLVRVRLCPPPAVANGPFARPARALAWLLLRPWLAAGSRAAGLAPLPVREPLSRLASEGVLELHAYSPALVAEGAGHDGTARPTGFWFLEGRLDPPPTQALLDFLAAGPPPVCVDFGSMPDDDPDATTALALEALGRAGRRGVLIRGARRFRAAALPDGVFAVDAVDHAELFERCAAVVHHGGAGTLAATLRAGAPSVVVPHMLDQRAWGRRLYELGVAPRPIPRRKLSAGRLHEGIAAAVTGEMRERAAALGERIRAEDGVACALGLFEQCSTVAVEPRATVTND